MLNFKRAFSLSSFTLIKRLFSSSLLSASNLDSSLCFIQAGILHDVAFELWCWRRLLRVPWIARRSNQSPKGDQSWVFIGRTDVEAETPILWPPDSKSWLIWKDPDAGKDWGQEEKRMTEDEMIGWHYRLNGHGFGWTPGVGDGQGGLACCGSWGHKESDTTERLNWTEGSLNHVSQLHYFTDVELKI